MKVMKTLGLVAVLALAGCAGNGPEDTAVRFVKAINALDLKTAASLSTEEGKATFEAMENLITAAQDPSADPQAKAQMDEYKAQAAKADVQVVKTTVDGETATVEYKVIGLPKMEGETASEPETQTLNLKLVDGVWKVDMKKQS